MIFNTLLLTLASSLVANAAIYVTQPSAGSTCHGGQSCPVSWLDDGQAPLLSTIGVTTLALYTGDLQLVQYIQVVNVSDTHSLTFTPNPQAGPNSGSYYIAFISDSDSAYRGYSPWFSLDNMSGSFASPYPAATSSLPFTSASGSPATETTGTQSGSTSAATSSGTLTSTTETSATSGATGATSSGFSTIRSSASSGASAATSSGATSSGSTASGTSSGATSSGSTTRTSTSSTSTPFNAAVSNNIPATGFAWTLLALLGAALL